MRDITRNEKVLLTVDPRGVATLTLNSLANHHALGTELIRQFKDKIYQISGEIGKTKPARPSARPSDAGRPPVRLLILTASGRKSFCAGADLKQMRQWTGHRPGEGNFDENVADARALAQIYRLLDQLPIPLVARVNGSAFGGGVGLMAVADYGLALSTARFGLPEVRLGLIPAVISPYLIRRAGKGGPAANILRYYVLSGESFGAEKAKEIGLVQELFPDLSLLDARLEEVVTQLLAAQTRTQQLAKRWWRRYSCLGEDGDGDGDGGPAAHHLIFVPGPWQNYGPKRLKRPKKDEKAL